MPLGELEIEISAASVDRWGHPSWRNRGPECAPTYFMTEDHSVFCRFWPVKSQNLDLRVWHWFDPRRLGPNQPLRIQSVAHLRELLATL